MQSHTRQQAVTDLLIRWAARSGCDVQQLANVLGWTDDSIFYKPSLSEHLLHAITPDSIRDLLRLVGPQPDLEIVRLVALLDLPSENDTQIAALEDIEEQDWAMTSSFVRTLPMDVILGDKVMGDSVRGHKITFNLHFHTDTNAPLDHALPTAPPPGEYPESSSPHYIVRRDVYDQLKHQILQRPTPQRLTLTAIHGVGGVGKTTLAAALASDPAIQARFPDGVLWMTLGQEPNIAAEIHSWVQQCHGGDTARFTSIADRAGYLRSWLEKRAVLLVIDDVWHSDDVRSLRVGGPRCHVLLTTRRAMIAGDAGAKLISINPMTEAEAIALLEQQIGQELIGAERQSAERLARLLGFLPLALNLAAARIAYGHASWDELNEALQREIAFLEELEHPAHRLGHTLRLEASFNLSLQELRRLSMKAWEAFVQLALLPEDALITTPAAATLWDVEIADAKPLLHLLRDEALLMQPTSVQIAGQAWPAFRLHDLLHDTARRLLIASPPKGLGLTWRTAQQALIERYRSRAPHAHWHRLPDDGYIHKHLAWHLVQAEDIPQLLALLREETDAGHNGWYETRERLGQIAGYIDDLEQAIQLTNKCALPGMSHIAQQCRHALLIATMSGLADHIPPTLLRMLVQHHFLSLEQARVYLQQRQEPAQDDLPPASFTEKPAPPIPAAELARLLRAAKAEANPKQSAKALIRLAPQLTGTSLDDAIRWTDTRRQRTLYEPALAALAVRLAALGSCQRALALIRTLDEPRVRARALHDVAPHLPAAALADALTIAGSLRYAKARTKALDGLASRLPRELLTSAWAATQLFADVWAQEAALIALAPYLGPPARHNLVARALAAPLHQGPNGLLAKLIPHVPDDIRLQVLRHACALEQREQRHQLLLYLAPFLPAAIQAAATAELTSASAPTLRRSTLLRLAPCLPEEQHAEAIQSIGELGSPKERSKALLWLAPYLSERLLRAAIPLAQKISHAHFRDETLAGIAPYLPDDVLASWIAKPDQAGFSSSSLVVQERMQTLWVQRLARRGQRDEASALLQRLPPPMLRGTLATVAAYLSAAAIRELLETHPYGSQLSDADYAAMVLRLASCGEPLAALRLSTSLPQKPQAAALGALATTVPYPILDEILTQSTSLPSSGRAKVLIACASREQLATDRRHELVQEILDVLKHMQRYEFLALLGQLVPVIVTLDGAQAADELFEAIEEVCRWFP